MESSITKKVISWRQKKLKKKKHRRLKNHSKPPKLVIGMDISKQFI